MKKITLLLFILLCNSIAVSAQRIPTGNLTVFSEDGSKFFLELNGMRYNTVAQANVRIEELPAPYYNCRIVFADSRKPMINKKNVSVADGNGVMQDVTYRIKKDRKGRRILNVYAYVPAQQNMVRPSNCAVYRCGRADDIIMGADGTMYTQQVTVQQTTTNENFGINMGGIGVNVNVPGSTTTTTTTTTTTSGNGYGNQNGGYANNGYGQNNNNNNGNNGYNYNGYGQNNGNNQNNNNGYNNNGNNQNGYNQNNNQSNNGGVCRVAMNSGDFEAAKSAVKDNHFDDTRISTAKEVLANNCMSATQVLSLVQLITFEGDRMELAKYAYTYCIDKNNYYKVNSAFTFESSKTELNDYIKLQR